MREQIISYEQLKKLKEGRSVMVCFSDLAGMPPPLCAPSLRPIIDSVYYNAGEVGLKRTGMPKITEKKWPKYYIQTDNDGYFHKEAYFLIKYKCKTCSSAEYIWNSRDGVTPFIVPCKTCSKEAYHGSWDQDQRIIQYDPPQRSRIFIDTPKEIHDFLLRVRINRQWEDGSYPMMVHFPSKSSAFKELEKDYNPNQPYLLTMP